MKNRNSVETYVKNEQSKMENHNKKQTIKNEKNFICKYVYKDILTNNWKQIGKIYNCKIDINDERIKKLLHKAYWPISIREIYLAKVLIPFMKDYQTIKIFGKYKSGLLVAMYLVNVVLLIYYPCAKGIWTNDDNSTSNGNLLIADYSDALDIIFLIDQLLLLIFWYFTDSIGIRQIYLKNKIEKIKSGLMFLFFCILSFFIAYFAYVINISDTTKTRNEDNGSSNFFNIINHEYPSPSPTTYAPSPYPFYDLHSDLSVDARQCNHYYTKMFDKCYAPSNSDSSYQYIYNYSETRDTCYVYKSTYSGKRNCDSSTLSSNTLIDICYNSSKNIYNDDCVCHINPKLKQECDHCVVSSCSGCSVDKCGQDKNSLGSYSSNDKYYRLYYVVNYCEATNNGNSSFSYTFDDNSNTLEMYSYNNGKCSGYRSSSSVIADAQFGQCGCKGSNSKNCQKTSYKTEIIIWHNGKANNGYQLTTRNELLLLIDITIVIVINAICL